MNLSREMVVVALRLVVVGLGFTFLLHLFHSFILFVTVAPDISALLLARRPILPLSPILV